MKPKTIPENELMEVSLYLQRAFPATAADNTLHCKFCGRDHCEWETAINLGNGTVQVTGVCERCRTHLKPVPPPPPPDGFLHVDDFIDDYRKDPYARFVLDYFRHTALSSNAFWPWMQHHPLFCTYQDTVGEGKQRGRYRVTGASRLGDIWLAADFKRDTGYDYRVNIADCIDWSPTP